MRNSSWSRPFSDHMELILTGTGLLVIIAVPLLPFVPDGWMVVAVTAIGVGVLHGLLFWIVRRRQRELRQATLLEVRSMLRDRISDQLHTLLRAAAPPTRSLDSAERARLASVVHAVREVETALEILSEESLLAWKASTSVDQPPPPARP